MTLRAKLTSALGVVLAGAAVLCVVAQGGVESLRSEISGAVNGGARKQYLASEIGTATAEMGALARAIMLSSVLQQADKVTAHKNNYQVAAARLEKSLNEFRALGTTSDERGGADALASKAAALRQAHEEYVALLANQQMDIALKTFDEKLLPRVEDIAAAGEALVAQQSAALARTVENANAKALRSRWSTMALMAVLLVVGAAGAVVVRRTGSTLRNLAAEMAEGAAQVASAAAQVSSSGQSLSQGASEQAANLERTSASTEDITSVAKENEETAGAMEELMGRSRQAVDQANRMLGEMVASMRDINSSSDRISKIIKVIDEIAFQTNILALNAAVEAARAGDAGLGFAVVADEVRNLAQRCAQAAKDTSHLIEESIATSKEGSVKLDQVAGSIRALTEHSEELAGMVGRINEGSRNQSVRTRQISAAVAEIGQITQRTAAVAEESASAGSELSAQADSLNRAVQEFRFLVDGASYSAAG